MAIKHLSATLLAQVDATPIYTLGTEYCEETSAGDKKYKYIQYYGTTITTAGTYSIVVPNAESNFNPTVYSSDKVNMVVDAIGSFTGIAIGALTATNKYGFIQVEGPSHIRDSMPAGGITLGQKLISTAAGADKTAQGTGTTTHVEGIFAIASSAATGTTTNINIYLLGQGAGI